MLSRTLCRALTTATAVAAVAGTPGAAAAATTTFTGTSSTSCMKPPAPVLGTSSGAGTCSTTAHDSTCVSGVDTGELAVVANCSADLVATTSMTFLQFRREQAGTVEVHCFGTGGGIFKYRATPTSPIIDIPVTVTVTDGYATFSGVSSGGIRVTAVEGAYTASCGGTGSYAGEVL